MGAFDDLVPKGQGGAAGGGGAFSDLVPTPEQERAARLRQIARAANEQFNGKPGAGDIFSDTWTWGLMKPVAGAAGAASEGFKNLFRGDEEDVGLGEAYTANVGAYQDRLDEARKNTGALGTAADIAGAITSGGPARHAMGKLTLPRVIGQAATQGAVEGAARNSEDLKSAAWGGGVNAAAAAALTSVAKPVIDQAAKLLPGAAAERAAERTAARGPDADVLKGEARNLYKRLDEAGIAYNNTQASDLVDNTIADLRQAGWDPGGVHAGLDKIITDLEGMGGKPMSLETLQNLRERVGAAAREGDPQIRRVAGRVLNQIDGFVDKQAPALSQLGSDVGPMWKEARQKWRAANAVDDMEWRLDKAERRAASTNSGQNAENAIRQNVRQVQDRATQPGRYKPYNEAELEQMNRVVEGSTLQNALRTGGNYLSGFPGMASGTAAAVTGGMTGHLDPAISAGLAMGIPAAAWTGGQALKNKAADMARDEADTLVRLIATGSKAPLAVPPGPPTREALARLRAKEQAARSVGNVGSGRF